MTAQQERSHSITHDPIYYITVAFFALLTTALPALLGQPRFLPIIQTLSLVSFVTVALHHRNVAGALRVMIIWLPIQFILITGLTWAFGGQLEAALPDGFAYRAEITAWYYGGATHPNGLVASPLSYLIEIAAIVVGSLLSAGLVGVWFLVRMLNLAGYGGGVLLTTLATPFQGALVIPYWTLLRAAGYAPTIVLCAMPMLTSQWSPAYYWRNHRKLVLTALTLIVLGLLVELLLPSIVARPPLN